MDIYCQRCGEPYEVSYFYDLLREGKAIYEGEGFKLSKSKGILSCGCCKSNLKRNGGPMQEAKMAKQIAEMCPGDIDGQAAFGEDAVWLGLHEEL